jgi:hypothetical protein
LIDKCFTETKQQRNNAVCGASTASSSATMIRLNDLRHAYLQKTGTVALQTGALVENRGPLLPALIY